MARDVGDLRPGRSRPLRTAFLIDSTASLDGRLDALLERPSGWRRRRRCAGPPDHRPGEHGGGGGAVTGDVVGLLGDFLDQLGADLLVRVLELDLLGDGDAVVRDRGGAPLLLEHDVAALRAEGDATASASWFMPRSSARRASSSKEMIFAAIPSPFRLVGLPGGDRWMSSHPRSRTASTRRCRVLTIVAANPHGVATHFHEAGRCPSARCRVSDTWQARFGSTLREPYEGA